jgi:hypothetical protein
MRILKLNLVLLAALGVACGSSPASGPGGPGQQAGGGASMGGGGTNGTAGSVVGTGGLAPTATPAGRVTLHRLNAREYDNTIRDLVGLDLKTSASLEFPADEWGDGFDNDGDVLTTSSLGAEKYLQGAQLVVKSALADAGARAKLLTCSLDGATEAQCLSTTVTEFARRAFRRPVSAEELAPYLGLVQVAKGQGDSAEVGLGLALAALLASPDFLFRAEPDPAPGVVRALNGYEVASRLSYFLWSSMPDEALFQAASQGQLVQSAGVATQVQRMLADPKAAAFSEVLATQWMQTVALRYAEPNATIFPSWKPTLRAAMEQELRAFFEPIVKGAAPATDLLAASYTYVNKELATFYGLPNAASLSDQFQRVELAQSNRGGVLRQGSFLVLTSHPDRNSPTKRGKWILDRLLCDPPLPPPANVPALDPSVPFEGSLRQRLDQLHKKAGPACAGCHAVTDPMGFALENYDAIGLWRDMDGAYPIDASGTMPGSGVPFNGAAEVTQAIVADERFPACVAKQVLTFALGRHVTDADAPLIAELGVKFTQGGSKLPQLAELIATSVPMMFRETEAQ